MTKVNGVDISKEFFKNAGVQNLRDAVLNAGVLSKRPEYAGIPEWQIAHYLYIKNLKSDNGVLKSAYISLFDDATSKDIKVPENSRNIKSLDALDVTLYNKQFDGVTKTELITGMSMGENMEITPEAVKAYDVSKTFEYVEATRDSLVIGKFSSDCERIMGCSENDAATYEAEYADKHNTKVIMIALDGVYENIREFHKDYSALKENIAPEKTPLVSAKKKAVQKPQRSKGFELDM